MEWQSESYWARSGECSATTCVPWSLRQQGGQCGSQSLLVSFRAFVSFFLSVLVASAASQSAPCSPPACLPARPPSLTHHTQERRCIFKVPLETHYGAAKERVGAAHSLVSRRPVEAPQPTPPRLPALTFCVACCRCRPASLSCREHARVLLRPAAWGSAMPRLGRPLRPK